MKCDAVQNRILAAGDPRDPGAEIAAHLNSCVACVAVQQQAIALGVCLKNLPAPPSSAERKAAFLEKIQEAGPIIKSIPRSRHTPSGSMRIPSRVRWDALAGLAAAIIVCVGGFWYFTRPKSPIPEVAEKPRHELLKKEIQHVTKLANSDTAPQRMTIWAEWASDVKSETKELYKVAGSEELLALGRLFDRAVIEGLIPQAKMLDPHLPAAERQALFADCLARLGEAETEATQLAQNAPPEAQKTLKKMAQTARTARVALEPLAKGV